jgi:sugar O-acyltransferase (sialic acid O-acetyltransferase NeuD family)
MNSLNAKKIIVLGAGGHASVVLDILSRRNELIFGIIAHQNHLSSKLPYLGDDSYLDDMNDPRVCLVNGIGRNGFENLRANIFNKYKDRNFHFLSLVHPSVILAEDLVLGEGVQLMAGAIIQSRTTIAENVVINTAASIDHDVEIGEHVFIGPGAIICGGVKIKSNAFIGAGAVILPGIEIGHFSVVAAGAVVLNHLPDNVLVAGNPGVVKGVYKHDQLERSDCSNEWFN